MVKISCIAIDDEPLALENMKKYISQMNMLNLEGLFTKPLKAVEYLNNHYTDLIFLDIEMDMLTGLQLLETLTYQPQVVLTTAYDKYAVKGYDYDVTDYLLKPFSFERFVKAVNKASSQMAKKTSIYSLPEENNARKEYMFIKTNYQMEKVSYSDILYIKSMNNYLIIKTPDKSFFTISSFQKIQDLLPGDNFKRLHKSYIVSLEKTDIINKNSVRIGKTSIPIGESYKKDFFNSLEENNLL